MGDQFHAAKIRIYGCIYCNDYEIISDDPNNIIKTIKEKSLNKNIDVIITTGGTGLTGRDNTVHSLKSIAEIEIPGFGELFRQLCYQKIGTSTIQSLASAFLVNKKYVFCLPGSVSAVKDAWNDILFYQFIPFLIVFLTKLEKKSSYRAQQ